MMHPDSLLSTKPDIRLFGKVDGPMLQEFFRQQALILEAPQRPDRAVILELSTNGGDADIGRRMAQELLYWREVRGQEIVFIGKTFVYSAGITIMSAIDASHRFMTDDCELLIHERKIKKSVDLDGALRGCRTIIQDILAEIDSGQRLERQGFEQLVKGTGLTIDDVMNKVLERDWYLTAREAFNVGLVAGLL